MWKGEKGEEREGRGRMKLGFQGCVTVYKRIRPARGFGTLTSVLVAANTALLSCCPRRNAYYNFGPVTSSQLYV